MVDYRTFRMTVPSDQQAIDTGKPYVSDLYVDPETNSLVLIDDAHAVAQHVGQRVHTFYGEWYLDTEIGVQWLQEVMGKDRTKGLIVAEMLLRNEITATPGVKDIHAIDLSYNAQTRGVLTDTLQVSTDFDKVVDVNSPF